MLEYDSVKRYVNVELLGSEYREKSVKENFYAK